MAVLTLKNKFEVTLIKLIQVAKKEGGIPKSFKINIDEAYDILKEIHQMGSNSRFTFEIETGEDPRFKLRNLDAEIAKVIIWRWVSKEICVYFNYDSIKLPVYVFIK